MLERVILEALGGKQAIEGRIRAELQRLLAGGYLPAEEVERVTREALAAMQSGLSGLAGPDGLAGSAAEAVGRLRPVGEHTARAVRELLDVPSRAELEALRAELRASEPRPER